MIKEEYYCDLCGRHYYLNKNNPIVTIQEWDKNRYPKITYQEICPECAKKILALKTDRAKKY